MTRAQTCACISLALAVIVGVSASLSPQPVAERSFIVKNDSFVKDGEVIQLRSASIHYSRVPRAYWKDRLQRMQAMGLNALSTYVPWNWHESVEGTYEFDGDHDLAEFLRVANEVGMLVLLRAGPYVCGEWEFGGFPAWILNHNVTIRTYEKNYIALVDKWWAKLLGEVVKPLLYSNGGPVVMVQMENEYGSYGDVSKHPLDKQYMEHLVSTANTHLEKGSVLLYTTDGGNAGYMTRGSLPGGSVITTGDGGWACDAQAQFNPVGQNPCTNSEDYTGWLTHWGEHVANTSTSDYGVGKAVAAGHSFNLYMGHGGSNFGWMSGANGGGKSFQPHITSYDYDSPISEDGSHGYGNDGKDKFETLLAALKPYAPAGGFPAEPPPLARMAYGNVTLTEKASMLSDQSLRVLSRAGSIALSAPKAMESLGQNYGFVYYQARAAQQGTTLEIVDYPRDRAQVFIDDAYNGAIYRPQAAPLQLKTTASAGAKVGLLVENMGRLNFGGQMTDPKGIFTDVTLDGNKDALTKWEAWPLPLHYSDVSKLSFSSTSSCASFAGPTFLKGVLTISGAPKDTYLKPRGFVKGVMWVNGFNLGRYWETQGPQHAFFLPAPYLKTGANDVVILELEGGSKDCNIYFDDAPDFSGKPVTPCTGEPHNGEVLRLRDCDASQEDHQGWQLQNVSGGVRLALGGLCLSVGTAKDPQSSAPSAQLTSCNDASIVTVGPEHIVESRGGKCLDVTAHGAEPGEPVEWYACNTGSNQGWSTRETPSHVTQLVSKMDGKCLSACGAARTVVHARTMYV